MQPRLWTIVHYLFSLHDSVEILVCIICAAMKSFMASKIRPNCERLSTTHVQTYERLWNGIRLRYHLDQANAEKVKVRTSTPGVASLVFLGRNRLYQFIQINKQCNLPGADTLTWTGVDMCHIQTSSLDHELLVPGEKLRADPTLPSAACHQLYIPGRDLRYSSDCVYRTLKWEHDWIRTDGSSWGELVWEACRWE